MINLTFIVLILVLLGTLVSAKHGQSQLPSIKTGTADLRRLQRILPTSCSSELTELDKPIIASASVASAEGAQTGVLRMAALFSFWYAFNAGYNVFNAYVKKDLAFPVAAATMQLLVGLLTVSPLWALHIRTLPSMTMADITRLLPIAALNAAGHACSVVAMSVPGGGSFTHVVKAAEPVVSVLLGLLVQGAVPKPFTALSLLPITYGVAYASTLGKLNLATMSSEFGSTAAKLAMFSNVAFSLRSIFRRSLSKEYKQRTGLDAVNEHMMTTLLSLLLLLPVVAYYESIPALTVRLGELFQTPAFAFNMAVCGVCYYLYNELQNIVLGSLGAVPTAVGNTLKRVVIFAALWAFTPNEVFPWPKILGCAIAIAGCFSFAVFDSLKV